jgi:hypothetical protein
MQVALLDTVLMTCVRRNWYGVVGRSFRLPDIRTSTERSLLLTGKETRGHQDVTNSS